MFYCLYQITNLVNGKIYVGVHKTKNLNDGYMGSGKVIKSAIEKYGIDNFKKDILETFENAEAMYAREKEVVTDEFLLREDTYNLRRGGNGGFDYINKNISKSARYERQKNGGTNSWVTNRELLLDVLSEGRKKNHLSGKYRYDTFSGKKHKKETLEKMKKSQMGLQHGEKNSQFGTCWIYHELIGSKKCDKNLLPEYIDQGWIKGRKIKISTVIV